ncbi:hypothetical protein [Corynebacterium striatum]|uniref:hypothetical protein n=1 Tax=Corynebacterium striatum TaxID=43770 RepID=UPI003B5C3A22
MDKPKTLKTAASLLSVLALLPVLSGTAQAETTQGKQEDPQTIMGGNYQSTDPTAYNYLPEGSDPVPNTADRSAFGAATINGFGFEFQGHNFKVPVVTLEHAIEGKGHHIDSESASATFTNGTMCNWRVDYQNRDEHGIHATRKGKTHNDCSLGHVHDDGFKNSDVKGNAECARLFVMGEFRGEQCHAIHP